MDLPSSPHRIEGIQYLRALAILLILFHHSIESLLIHPQSMVDLFYAHTTFWSGVDLFFAISGFVIMKGFLNSLEKNKKFWPTLKQFWIKRFFRILPSAWLWLVLYLLCTQYFNSSTIFGNLSQNLNDSLAATLQYANYYGLQCWGPGKTMQCGPNGIYWSLSLEEQFYLVLPMLIFIFRNHLRWVMVASILAQFFIPRPAWTLGWAFRFDAISWGVLLAICYQRNQLRLLEPKFLKNHKLISSFVLVFLLGGLVYFPAGPNQFEYGVGITAVFAALLVSLSSYNQAYLFPFKYFNRVLNWLGSRSYSLYLVHIVVFCLTIEGVYRWSPANYHLSAEDNWLLLAIALPLLAAVAELNYRFIEKPLRDLGYRLAGARSS